MIIQIDDSYIEKLIQQEGVEKLKNEFLDFITNKFIRNEKLNIHNTLDKRIRKQQGNNKENADRVKDAIENLHKLIDVDSRDITLRKAQEQYYGMARSKNEYQGIC